MLAQAGKTSQRERLLPAPAVVYCVMVMVMVLALALALWRETPLEQVLRPLARPDAPGRGIGA